MNHAVSERVCHGMKSAESFSFNLSAVDEGFKIIKRSNKSLLTFNVWLHYFLFRLL